MKTKRECIPCLLEQAVRTARMVTQDEQKIKQVQDELGEIINEISMESTPPMLAKMMYEKVAMITGENDPYRELKHRSTLEALDLYPSVKEQVRRSKDPLLTAIKFAAIGNVIDFGVNHGYGLLDEISDVLKREFGVFDFKAFKEHLSNANDVLYIGDNAGESVFDRILIEEMGKNVTYIVRGGPIINDVTRKEALQAGLDKVAAIISTGTAIPGVVPKYCSSEFNAAYDNADMVISKGQGNYESLSEEERPIFFLLIVKCDLVAEHIGVQKGELVLKGINSNSSCGYP